MKTLKSKKNWIKIAKEHQKYDRFIQGKWLDEKIKDYYSGCFYGCMTQTNDNTLLEASKVMELPLWLVYLSEKIFEGLPKEDALLFPVQLLEAVSIKMDEEKVWKRFMYELLMDKEKGQITFTKKNSLQYKAVKQCADLFLDDEINQSATRSTAESAAWSAWSAESAESAAYKSIGDKLIELLEKA